ncbi:TPA: aconitate hydratase, partial [Candidatus Geothermarchaeota archaeon]|nr:aconitate hydratase [Candidatus Geothermarchaeota archaeon]
SFAPGSSVVPSYLENSGLMPYLEALGFHIVGFGCTTCIGNSGPLPKDLEEVISKNRLYTAAVLSGNRNFLGRIHPLTAGNFLASPIMVVAYALKGSIYWDPLSEPIGYRLDGRPVYLRDIWPSTQEIREVINKYVTPELFRERYKDIYEGPSRWRRIEAPESTLYIWDDKSTFIRKPPFLDGFKLDVDKPRNIIGARVLVLLGDRVSTDHISPAGRIPVDSPAGRYLLENGVALEKFGTYGARRGNHEVMMRGTFANTRIRNLLVDREGGYTIYWPTKEITTVYDAAMRYRRDGTPLIVLAGKNYGVGSSRDWAAKGPYLLGVKAVIAESFERIHRSNLIGMGILPLEFMDGENRTSLGLDGSEIYNITGLEDGLSPQKVLRVEAVKEDGEKIIFNVLARLDNMVEVEYYINGGILPYVLRKIVKSYRGK